MFWAPLLFRIFKIRFPVFLNMTEPLVSIVLPTYNRSHYLGQAVQSCLDQTHSNWELIIVDDGSTDDTSAKTDFFMAKDSRIRCFRHEANRNLPSALNTGFAQAKGIYLTWLADDDWFRPHALSSMVSFLESRPEVGLVYADFTVVDEQGLQTRLVRADNPDQLVHFNPIGPCKLYRRAVQEKIGHYAEDLFFVEDYDYWLRVSTQFRLEPFHQDLYVVRDHRSSLSRLFLRETRALADKALAKNLPFLPWVNRMARAGAYLYLSRVSLSRKEKVLAIKYFFYAALISPDLMVRQMLRSLL